MIKRIVSKFKNIVIPIILLFLAACGTFEYSGDYPELFTVASNSILGVQGGFSHRATIQP